ncbi:Uu.00g073280.m01.CDS01 [Anthostomella pinea]|uniref:Uu.00g073280.m01.CDS01 n=1 Tax=Anthostomella pinea TaxID=933095 RepID=A0AAI8YNX1_9PEZI|nr:Uu.00g073280.m01.CDS01 [Anthostomella pinea]
MDSQQQVPNNGPLLNGSVWTLVVMSLVFLALRLWCKYLSHRGLWWDDHILIISWVVMLVSSSMISNSVALGFGMHAPDIIAKNHGPQVLPEIAFRGAIQGMLLVLGNVWSKTSFAVTLLRITDGKLKALVWVIIITMNVFMIVGGLLNFAQCTPAEKVWKPDTPGTCWSPGVYVGFSIFAGAYSALMDIGLAMLPWAVILKLQMKTKEKIGVAVAMSMGVFAAITSILKCTYIVTLEGNDFLYEGVHLLIWSTAETATTIIAASIPVLRVLFLEMRSSNGRYYEHSSANGTKKPRQGRTGNNTVTVTATGRPRTTQFSKDDDSDRSILHGTGIGKITKTDEVRIHFHDRSDAESEGIELDTMASRADP